MKTHHTADSIPAAELSGYATELTAWRLLSDVSQSLLRLHESGKAHGHVVLSEIMLKDAHFALSEGSQPSTPAADIWQLGACIHEFITGTTPFGGKGMQGQTALSPLPSFSPSKASTELSLLMQQCLAYEESARISIKEVADVAQRELQRCQAYHADKEHLKYHHPQNRTTRMKNYAFWPEAMATLLLFFLLAMPQAASAQVDAEMQKLVRLTTSMRQQGNRQKVLGELLADKHWTMMDELPRHTGECSFRDKVSMFGINGIANEIASREKGIVNVGGRFRDSRNANYPYSFVELTARARQTISYTVTEHKGTQQVAIIPFDAKQKYSATFYVDGVKVQPASTAAGTTYFVFTASKKGTYEFRISNDGTANASFAVITYNSGK